MRGKFLSELIKQTILVGEWWTYSKGLGGNAKKMELVLFIKRS